MARRSLQHQRRVNASVIGQQAAFDAKVTAGGATNLVVGTSLANLRQEIAITLLNEQGQPVIRYLVHRCWVSEFQALPDLDAGANAVAIEHIKLENEGWERDLTLAEPTET